MVKAVPAVLLGAGGATVAMEYGSDLQGYIKEVARAITHHSTRPGTTPSSDNSSLSSEIDSLKRLMMENNRGQVVVMDRGRSSGWGLLPYLVGFLGLGYCYIRFVKGYKLADLMYVSQASLKASSNALKQGIDGLKEYTSKTKEYLTGRLNTLEDDQKLHMEKTEKLDDRLINLGDTVDEMHVELSEVNTSVQHVRGTLGEIQDAQKYSSQGIFLLLKVVGELVYHNDFKIRSRSELEQFSRMTPPMVEGAPPPGLQSLLNMSEDTHKAMIDYAPGDVEEVQRTYSGDTASSGNSGMRATPKVWTRDSRNLSQQKKDSFGLGSLRQRN